MSKNSSHGLAGRIALFTVVVAFLGLGIVTGTTSASEFSFLESVKGLFSGTALTSDSSLTPRVDQSQSKDRGRVLGPDASTTIVISQVYPGGGSSSAGVTYKKDYVELKNISASPQSLSGLALQYGSSTGNLGNTSNAIFTLNPAVTLQPGQYYLVELGTAGTGGADISPAPDESTTNLSMAAGSGKVALTNTSTGLGCGATATACTLPHANIIDLVAWGASNNAEGGTSANNGTALPVNTNGVVRKGNGCTDTDNNNADFDVVANPVPRNSATTASPCTAPAPDMVVQGGSPLVTITDGDLVPSTTDGTDFGSDEVGGTAVSHFFTISNLGPAGLELTSSPNYVQLTGDTSDFTVEQQPGYFGPIPSSSPVQFRIDFNPTTTGLRTVDVSIPNNDPDENPYNFRIQGTGTAPVLPTTTVVSLTRQHVNPTNLSDVLWQVVFANAVSGLTTSNFSIVQGGAVTGASVTSVTATSGPPTTTWNISVSTGTGSGTLGLNVANDTGLTHDVTNLPFTGEVYTIDKTAPPAPVITGSNPTSPNSSTTPEIQGTAEIGSSILIYASASCGGDSVGSGTADGSGSFSVPVFASANNATTYTVTATDAQGNVSACSNQFTYTNVSEPPTGLYIVNTIADTDDGSCDPLGVSGGDCSLRDAINEANSDEMASTINFNIPDQAPGFAAPTDGVKTIEVLSDLPTLSQPVTIDGYTQPGAEENTQAVGSDAVLLIEIKGEGGVTTDTGPTSVDATNYGLVVDGGSSTITGLVISGFSQAQIFVTSDNNVIAGNYIGTDAAGMAIAENPGFSGIRVDGDSNTIGGTAPADRNLVTGNYFGIDIFSQLNELPFQRNIASATGNTVQGNYVGTNAQGEAIGNSQENGFLVGIIGIEVESSDDNNIGGTTPGAGNLVSGQSFTGIDISGSMGTIVNGNRIGTNASGETEIGNGTGINICGCSFGTTIGSVGAGNQISGNNLNGISMSNNLRLVGKPWSETLAALPKNAAERLTTLLKRNGRAEVATRPGLGMDVIVAPPVVIQGNLIGTGADGIAELPNGLHGISIETFSESTFAPTVETGTTVIGGTADGEGNVIAFNGRNGVQIGAGIINPNLPDRQLAPTALQGNRISGNSIHSNGTSLNGGPGAAKLAGEIGLGIDLGGDGVTPNDALDQDIGPNNLQNYPVIETATSGSPGTISGTLNTRPVTSSYQIEFFANESCDPSDFGEGQTFLGFTTTGTTDASGNVAFTFTDADLTNGQFITATATDTEGNTSEFSACTEVTGPQTDLTVTKTTSQESVVAGENLTYTITVANGGPDAATSVTLVDAIPTGTTLVSFTPAAGWACNNIAAGATGTFTCTNPSLAAETSSVFTLVVNVNSSVASGGQISNTATVTAAEDPTGDASTVVTPVTASAEVAITKLANRETVAAGENITYTITVNNTGPSDATSLTFTDAIPAGTTLVSFTSPAGWTCNSISAGGTGTFTCTNPSLVDGASAVFTMVVKVNQDLASGGEISNTATVSTPQDESQGSATVVTPVTTSSDLAVTKLADLETIAAGGNITYTIAVSNAGPSDAATVTLTDILPAGTTFVSLSSPEGWTCTTPAVGAGGTISCTRTSVSAGAVNPPFQVVVNVPVGTPSGTEITNAASVNSAVAADPNVANNSATATTTVLATTVDISGNVQQFNVPFANTPLQGVLITLTGPGVPADTTRTTDAAGNYSFEDLDAGGTYTVTPSMAGKTFDPASRTYPNLTTDVTNANFVAYDSQLRNLRAVNGYTMPGDQVTVPIVLTAQGNERTVKFRLTYTEELLDVLAVNCGAASGPDCTVVYTAVNGVLDVTVTKAFGTYSAGQKEIVTILFDTVPTQQPQTPLIFTAEGNLTTDSGGNPLETSYTNGYVVFGQGKECDVAERYTGDRIFQSDDGDIMRLMIAGAPLNGAYNEFQRADCAPFETKGDGKLDATDFQIMSLTVAVLVPQQSVGGPFGPLPEPTPFAGAIGDTQREMRVVPTQAAAGDRVTVEIELDARGDETAASFTLGFDPMKLRNPRVALANGMPSGAHLTANTERAAEGRIMMLIDSMDSLAQGRSRFVTVTFDVVASAASGQTELYFTSDPTGSAISDKQARSLETRFTSGTVSINGSNPEGVHISGRVYTPEGLGLRNAVVLLTDEAGVSRTVITSSMGYYSFEGVAPGRTYRIAAVSKRYRFAARSVEPAAGLVQVDLIAQE